jgi:hypothetical protein
MSSDKLSLFVKLNDSKVVSSEDNMLLSGFNSKAVKVWRKKNVEAQTEIVLHIKVLQLAHVHDENSEHIWNNLETMHCSHGLVLCLTLHHHFLTMHKRAKSAND